MYKHRKCRLDIKSINHLFYRYKNNSFKVVRQRNYCFVCCLVPRYDQIYWKTIYFLSNRIKSLRSMYHIVAVATSYTGRMTIAGFNIEMSFQHVCQMKVFEY